jgi:phage tail-like protein
LPNRNDPYPSFRFLVEIESISIASFSEVSGLQVEMETEAYREGGVNNFVHTFPKGIKHQPLVLKRGITDSYDLWDWYKEVIDGVISRKDVTVVLMDSSGNEKKRWFFLNAYPIKWTGPTLKADSNTIAIESIELAHQGIYYVK